MPEPRRRSRAVAAPLAALLAVAVSGCGTSSQSRGVCRDERTDQRVDDAQCSRRVGGFGWWYFSSGRRYPAIGQAVSTAPEGSATPQAGAKVVRGGAPAAGGTVAKGGFGGHSGGKGVGG